MLTIPLILLILVVCVITLMYMSNPRNFKTNPYKYDGFSFVEKKKCRLSI